MLSIAGRTADHYSAERSDQQNRTKHSILVSCHLMHDATLASEFFFDLFPEAVGDLRLSGGRSLGFFRLVVRRR